MDHAGHILKWPNSDITFEGRVVPKALHGIATFVARSEVPLRVRLTDSTPPLNSVSPLTMSPEVYSAIRHLFAVDNRMAAVLWHGICQQLGLTNRRSEAPPEVEYAKAKRDARRKAVADRVLGRAARTTTAATTPSNATNTVQVKIEGEWVAVPATADDPFDVGAAVHRAMEEREYAKRLAIQMSCSGRSPVASEQWA